MMRFRELLSGFFSSRYLKLQL